MKTSKYVSFNLGNLTRLWDNESKISLDNPVMTSLITETVIHDDSPENLAKFNELYGLQADSDFKTLFDIFRMMTQEFLLGGANYTLPVGDYIFG